MIPPSPTPPLQGRRGFYGWTDYANNPLQGQVASQLALRRYLKDQLPDYMVPALFVTLDELPLTPNGKVDRKALPAPAKTRPRLTTGWVEPRSGIEQQVASIWQQVLGLDAVGTLDNFFDLGGNSLLLTLAHHRLEELLDREVPMAALFQYPTIQALARYLGESPGDAFSGSHAPAREQTRRSSVMKPWPLERRQVRSHAGTWERADSRMMQMITPGI